MGQSTQLIIRFPNWIGDAVMATPVLSYFPKVSVIAKPHIHALLEEHPSVEKMYSVKEPLQENYDVGLLLTNSFSSAWHLFRQGIPRRIGFKADCRGLLLTDSIPFPENRYTQHLSLTYQHLLQSLGKKNEKMPPRLFVSEKETAWARQRLGNGPLVGFHTHAAYGPAKCWPKERFQQVAQRLMKEGIRCVFFGAKDEAFEVSKYVPKGACDLSGQTTLRELMACLSICDAVISNDSGPMHIADALGTPVFSLFGSTEPKYTAPFSNTSRVLYKKTFCSPCFKRECPIDFRCMRSIQVEDVITKTLNFFNTP